jgi:hypothetical protein
MMEINVLCSTCRGCDVFFIYLQKLHHIFSFIQKFIGPFEDGDALQGDHRENAAGVDGGNSVIQSGAEMNMLLTIIVTGLAASLVPGYRAYRMALADGLAPRL